MDNKILVKLREYEDKIKDMGEYSNLHAMTYNTDNTDNNDLIEEAMYIHDNYNKMDEDEMKRLLTSLLSPL